MIASPTRISPPTCQVGPAVEAAGRVVSPLKVRPMRMGTTPTREDRDAGEVEVAQAGPPLVLRLGSRVEMA